MNKTQIKTKRKSRKWQSRNQISPEQIIKRNEIYNYWIQRIEERTGYKPEDYFAKGRHRKFFLIRIFLTNKFKSHGLWKCVELGEMMGNSRDWGCISHYLDSFNALLDVNDDLLLNLINLLEDEK